MIFLFLAVVLLILIGVLLKLFGENSEHDFEDRETREQMEYYGMTFKQVANPEWRRVK